MCNILQSYFGDELKYCKWSDDFEKRPTVCVETNFTMIHDLYLTFPLSDQVKHLVLFRHPLYSLASWRIHFKRDSGNICEDQDISKQKLELWAKWVNKWVLSPVPNRLIVSYERILENPTVALSKIIHFISNDMVNEERLSLSLLANPVVSNMPNTTDQWIGWL